MNIPNLSDWAVWNQIRSGDPHALGHNTLSERTRALESRTRKADRVVKSVCPYCGALISYVIENERYFKEYVVPYTNASAILREDYRDAEDLDGLFSGWVSEKGQYEGPSWRYEGEGFEEQEAHRVPESHAERAAHFDGLEVKPQGMDPTLQHPRIVFQVLKRHFARYTPQMVEEVCGIDPEQFYNVADLLCRNSGRERTTAFCYEVGWTQHSAGARFIRAAGILQLLMGNMGRPGGGIMALRGHATIQGSTDIPTLFNLLPGYFPMPKAGADNSLGAWENNIDKLLSVLGRNAQVV